MFVIQLMCVKHSLQFFMLTSQHHLHLLGTVSRLCVKLDSGSRISHLRSPWNVPMVRYGMIHCKTAQVQYYFVLLNYILSSGEQDSIIYFFSYLAHQMQKISACLLPNVDENDTLLWVWIMKCTIDGQLCLLHQDCESVKNIANIKESQR